jgi:hypothetical protein
MLPDSTPVYMMFNPDHSDGSAGFRSRGMKFALEL